MPNPNYLELLAIHAILVERPYISRTTDRKLQNWNGAIMTIKTIGENEGSFTGAIESQTSKIPSVVYLTAALGAMAGSAVLKISGKDNWALFVGQWAPAFLILGVYNKMVKQHGSDVYTKAA